MGHKVRSATYSAVEGASTKYQLALVVGIVLGPRQNSQMTVYFAGGFVGFAVQQTVVFIGEVAVREKEMAFSMYL